MSRRNAKQMLAIGALSGNSTNLPAYIGTADFSDVRHTRVCNASMPAMTAQELQQVLPRTPHRPGCMDAFALRSRGTGC